MDIRLPEKPKPVVRPGEFLFSAVGLAHGHIYGMTRALLEAGATLCEVWNDDPRKIAAFLKTFPQAKAALSLDAALSNPAVQLIASASVPSERCALGIRAMQAGKDYFVDKAPMTSLDQLAQARKAVAETGRKYMVYYSERLHSEAATMADHLIREGTIGRVLHTDGFGPHRLNLPTRPAWFFEKARYGGILCDIGSHQIEQFLHFTDSKDAVIQSAHKANYAHPDYPEFEDFGDCTLNGSNGTTGYFRIDWFTPDGLSNWGDGRTFILGTDGYIELRKVVDIASVMPGGNRVYWVDRQGEHKMDVSGLVGCPFFGQFILDCLNRTESAMTQEHAFRAAELCLRAQALADHS